MLSNNPPFFLKPYQVQAWAFNLDHAGQTIQGLEQLLSEDETSRSERYRFEQDRCRFVTRRGILRQLLGKYNGKDPAEIVFKTNAYGKLYLASEPIKFNLSSCQNMVVYCFTLGMEVGIDLEQVRVLEERESLVKNWFSPSEKAGLHALAPEKQTDAFYHVWTQKEAFLKAHGEGLSFPLDGFSVSVDPERSGELLSIKDGAEQASCWKIYTYAHLKGWRSAICAETKTSFEVTWYSPELAIFKTKVTAG
jgi:4'-phosphopantetheinyl transferase